MKNKARSEKMVTICNGHGRILTFHQNVVKWKLWADGYNIKWSSPTCSGYISICCVSTQWRCVGFAKIQIKKCILSRFFSQRYRRKNARCPICTLVVVFGQACATCSRPYILDAAEPKLRCLISVQGYWQHLRVGFHVTSGTYFLWRKIFCWQKVARENTEMPFLSY